mmetsp:Transcript_121041/g.328469  ORF Transcript_121041/g.328469 Transcript_121041/m.328469 type:complete len:380 (+) Transcript_121041:515-1654(+)
MQRPTAVAPAGASGEPRLVATGRHDLKAVLGAGVVAGQEPREGQRGGAQRALWGLQPAHAVLVELVLAGGRHRRVHHQRLGAQEAVHRAVQGERVAGGRQLEPVQLLGLVQGRPLRAGGPLRQCREEVAGALARRRSRRGGLLVARGRRRWLWRLLDGRAPLQQRLHQLAHHVAHVLLVAVVALELPQLLLLRGEIRVQEPRELALRPARPDAGVRCRALAVGLQVLQRLRGVLAADGTLGDAVLPRLMRDGAQHEALPAEAVATRKLHHVLERTQADGALLPVQLLGEAALATAARGRNLGALRPDERVAQRLDRCVQLCEVRAAEEGLPAQPAGPLDRRVLHPEIGLLPAFLQDFDHGHRVPYSVLPQLVDLSEDVH